MEYKPEIITCENGLRVVLHRLDYSKVCSINLHIAAGSYYENDETNGTSHFIEHTLFKGTVNRTALMIAEETDEIGGVTNAYTGKEITSFYTTALSEHAAKATDILCDMLVNPLFDEKDVETERGVIEEELNMYADSPEDVCLEASDEFVWQGSMLGAKILGPVENIRSMTGEKLRAFHGKFYVPERTVISICGNFDREKILAVIEKYFSGRKNTGFPPEKVRAEHHSGVITVERDFQQNQLILSFPGVYLGDKRKSASYLLANMLGASSSSRLFQRLREEMGIVYTVDCYNTCADEAGLFSICTGLSAEDEDEAIKEILKVIGEFSGTVTDKELSIAKEQAVSSLVMGLEGSSARAARNARHLLNYGRIIPDEESIEDFRKVTIEEIKELCSSVFIKDKICLCVTGKTRSTEHYSKILGGNYFGS